MNTVVWVLLLGIAVFLEGIGIKFPFTLMLLIFLYIRLDKEWIFIAALITGIALDSMTLQLIGLHSIIFVGALFLISLYEKKYEIQTVQFVFLATFLFSLIYLGVIGEGFCFIESIGAGIFMGICELGAQRFGKNTRKSELLAMDLN